jgi:hypothetical protein
MASRIVPEGGWSNLKPFKTPRVEKQSHLRFVKSLICVCCAAQGLTVQADDPLHIRSISLIHGKDETGGSRKSDDRWTLPGCRRHHDQQHGMNERNFWSMYRIDPFLLALVLWGLTGNEHAAVEVIRLHARGGV